MLSRVNLQNTNMLYNCRWHKQHLLDLQAIVALRHVPRLLVFVGLVHAEHTESEHHPPLVPPNCHWSSILQGNLRIWTMIYALFLVLCAASNPVGYKRE